ncbi:hypothetical protein MCEMSEM23_00159 [Rhabdaerophilaceae bacterium]
MCPPCRLLRSCKVLVLEGWYHVAARISRLASPRPSVNRLGALVWLLVGAGFLSGCGSSSTPDSGGFTTALIYGGRGFTEPPPEVKREYNCPRAEILEGTVAYRAGGADSARGVAHQAAIVDFARECALISPTQLRVRVGVRGRVVLGENGKPGTISVPVRIAVRRGEATVYSRLVPTAVTIPASDTQASFVMVEEQVLLPVSDRDPAEEFTILIGLDPQAQRPTRARRR